jgi:hypothetical protein
VRVYRIPPWCSTMRIESVISLRAIRSSMSLSAS